MEHACVKTRAPRNRTLRCDDREAATLGKRLLTLASPARAGEIQGKIIHQDIFDAAPRLPATFADLLILDPPYNLTKNYNGEVFHEKALRQYAGWFERILQAIKHTLKPSASVYACADWKT